MSSIEREFSEHTDQEFQEFLEFKEKRLREKGLLGDGSPLGDSVHKDTLKSYNKLKLSVPDSVRLASLRPYERAKRMFLELKNGKLDIQTVITSIFRLKDKNTGKEYLVWNKRESFKDNNDNVRRAEYMYCGCHQEVKGTVHRNVKGEVSNSEITDYITIFDKEFNKKNLDELLKQSNGDTSFKIAHTKNTGKNAVVSNADRQFAIKNIEDFTGKWNEVWELGERGLSGGEPSLGRLAQPIAEDGMNSLHKRQRGYLSPDKISYTQTSYR
jgi:hypothetical protein